MLKRFLMMTILVMLVFGSTHVLFGQGVLMNSAETIKKGNLKLALFPTLLFGRNGGDSIFGIGGRFGFGLTSSLDIEAKAGLFKGLNYYGVDLEYWFLKGGSINASVALGGHMTDADGGGDSSGIDTALIISTRPAKQLEFYGGLKLAFDSLKDSNFNYTLIHLVPGIEYKINDELDFLAEIGLSLNDHGHTYASVGLAYYFLN
jgi:hypothetical protein